MSEIYQYFVEGECEKKLVDKYKNVNSGKLIAGKVDVLNFINKEISNSRITVLNPKTVIILVYDIDVENIQCLENNIKKLNHFGFNRIYHVQSIKNFEDEISFASELKNVDSIFGTNTKNDFKREFLRCTNINYKLEKNGFNIDKIWTRENNKSPFDKYSKKEWLNVIHKKQMK